ncbi:hypothetical protein RIF29_14908 [Crotalaria pallida]|uniref:Nucleic acid binding NABP domain-containing protein n=1 Tax=Crotalaria pallida TaxID=3830 RepID=A0AAN9FE98_CROPI
MVKSIQPWSKTEARRIVQCQLRQLKDEVHDPVRLGLVQQKEQGLQYGEAINFRTTPDSQLLLRVASPCLPPIGDGRSCYADKTTSNGQNSFSNVSSTLNEPDDLVYGLTGMNLSANATLDVEKHPQSQRSNESDYSLDVKGPTYLNKLDFWVFILSLQGLWMPPQFFK